jgi:dTDP-glucose 4,6-dehydratase
MQKKILVTGSAGFVGSHFVTHLLKNTDWQIIGLDSFKHRGDSLRIYQDSERYKIYTCDLSTPISYRLLEQIGALDYIVNIASDSHVDRSITDPVPFVQNNVNLILYMLEFVRVHNQQFSDFSIEKFIQISTDEVYGAALEGMSHAEWSPILPSNPYSASKAAQEAIAISYWRTYGIPLIITNTMNMFGERQDKEKYIPMLISKIQKGEKVTIHGSESYIGKRHYLHARNFADSLLFLLNQEKKPTQYEDKDSIVFPDRYNIVGEVELDNLKLAQIVAEMLQKNLNYELVDFHRARPGHDRRYALDGRKIENLGWKQPFDFITSLRKTVDWTLENPIWMI